MGVEGGLTALYAQLRYLYGNAYYYNILTTGTDEATYGASADGNFKSADLSGAEALLPNNANSQNLWGQAFTYINTATGTGQPNASHARPFNIAKFSEFYFIASEAAVKGATGKGLCETGTCASSRHAAMEGLFGTQKEHYSLRRVKARKKETEIQYIFFGIHTTNVVLLAERLMEQQLAEAA